MTDDEIHIRVTKDENGKIKREIMHGAYTIREMQKAEIITLIQQATSTLRYD